ncbi:LamG-like jellyroll fold domain-containing protein [Dactylosporangium sp. CS-033363]|uniref:LamG-like jellyroll fold domain-containing protein n=1 Tax=Dactylosporangium sp. CS-033363 TaxID=3239935 RepID=UPI003D928B42
MNSVIPGRRRARKGLTGRIGRRVATVIAIVLVMVSGIPQGRPGTQAMAGWPVGWLTDWLGQPWSWSAPPLPPTPRQQDGTATGAAHSVPAGSTDARRGNGHAPGKGAGELPPYTPHVQAQTQTATAPKAGKFDKSTSKRSAKLSDARTDVFDNADGSVTKQIYQRDVNYRAADGSWTPIDTSIAAGSGGRLRQRANDVGLDLGPKAGDATLGSLQFDAAHRFAFRLSGAADVPATIDGDTATYSGVLPGTDLRLRMMPRGLKETIVLHSADAADTWTFPLALQGLTARAELDGSISLVDGAGVVTGTVPAGYMVDSNVDPHTGDPARSNAVTYRLTTVDGAPALQVSVDTAWLQDPARVFPVFVDPTVAPSWNTSSDTYVEPSNPGDNSHEATLRVGTSDVGGNGNAHANSFLKFDGFANGFANRRVTAVKLWLFNIWAYQCSSAAAFNVYHVFQNYNPASISFPGPAWDNQMGSLSQKATAATCANTGKNPNVGSWMGVDLDASTFDAWVRGDANYGVALSASMTNENAWKQFDSADAGANAPHIDVTYEDNVRPVVAAQYPPDNYNTPTLTPQLVANGSDPDNWPGTPLQYNFHIYTPDADSHPVEVNQSGFTSASRYTVPAGVLSWGKVYSWTVEVQDGVGAYSDQSAAIHTLVTGVPQPQILSRLSQNTSGQGYDARVGNYTSSGTDLTVATPGPALAVQRNYNSSDPRIAEAFGAGWASLLDARAAEQYDTNTGAVTTVTVTYPEGSDVAFGRNNDGKFVPPQGRFATFTPVSGGGYTLIDKNGTTYSFTQTLGGGAYGISSITDAAGRSETFAYTSGHITTMTSSASGRAIHLTWQTPTGAASPHVTTAASDPATTGDPNSVQTWTYTYSGDQLTKVCPPTSATACVTYAYTTGSPYAQMVQNTAPHSYWRLGETSGTAATSTVLANAGADNGTYTNVTLGGASALPGSTSKTATFNGTSSSVTLPPGLVNNLGFQTISLWFKTSTKNSVLFSYQGGPITSSPATSGYVPAMYIGQSGQLRGTFWDNNITTMASPAGGNVADGVWHQAVLSGAGGKQALYLDGTQVDTKNGTIQALDHLADNIYLGAGFIGGGWADNSHAGSNNATPLYFNGSMAEVAFYDQWLDPQTVAALYNAGHSSTKLLSTISERTGSTFAQVGYDSSNGRVNQVIDHNGGTWQIAAPAWAKDANNMPIATSVVTDPTNKQITYVNDLANGGRPISLTDGLGNTTTYGYDTGGFLHTVTDGAGKTETQGHDVRGNLVSRTTCQNQATNTCSTLYYTYLPDDTSTALDPNPLNDLISTIRDGRSSSATDNAYLTTMQYDAKGNVIGVTGPPLPGYPNGRKTTTTYTDGTTVAALDGGFAPPGLATTATTPGGSVSTTKYFHNGDVAQTIDASGLVTNYTYDNLGRALTTTITRGSNPGSSPVSSYTASTSTKTYLPADTATGLTGDDDYAQVTLPFAFSFYGQQYSSAWISTNGEMSFTDHGESDSQATALPDAAAPNAAIYPFWTDLIADTTSWIATKTVGAAPNRQFVIEWRDMQLYADSTKRVSFEVVLNEANGDVTTNYQGLDSDEPLELGSTAGVGVENADGTVATQYAYYDTNLADNTAVTFHSAQSSGSANLTTTFVYDKANRLVTVTSPPVLDRVTGAVHTAQVNTSYTESGAVLTRTTADLTGGDAPRTQSATYNSHDQMASSTDATNAKTTYGYDAYGNANKIVDATGQETDFLYDADGKLLTTTLVGYTGDPVNPSAATNLVLTSRAYDGSGRLASVTDAMGWVTSFTYTDNGLTATETRTDPVHDTSYVKTNNTYDAAGNVISTKTNDNTTTTSYTFDAAKRLTSATLDPTGVNRTTTYVYTPDDAILSTRLTDGTGASISGSASYDVAGHVTSSTTYDDSAGSPSGWWPLIGGETAYGATVVDTSGRQQTGYATADLAWSPEATFNGSGAAVATSGPAVNTTQSFTVSAWAKPANLTGTQTVVSQEGTNGAGYALKYSSSTGKWSFAMSGSDGGTLTQATSSTGATAGAWVHLTGVFDAATGAMTLYVDGSQAGTATLTGRWNAAGPVAIGRGHTAGAAAEWFNGAVANVQVYQRTISATEAATLHSNGRNGTALATNRPTTRYTYNDLGLAATQTDPNGNVTTFDYDEAGKRVALTAPAVNTETSGGTAVLAHPVTMTGYDTFGNPVEQVDANGRRAVIAYDAESRPVSSTAPSYTAPGSSTPIVATSYRTYTKLGEVATTTDPLGHQTTYAYDQLGNLATVTGPDTGVTHTTYDKLGDVLSVTDPTGAVAQSTYDYLGRKVTATEVVRQPSSQAYTTNYTYAAPAGRLSTVTTAGNVATSYTYNTVGETLTVKDGLNHTTGYTYDLAGRVTRTTAPDNTYTTAAYDGAGRPVRASAYDAGNNQLTTASTAYDRNGNMVSSTDPRGHTTTFAYDATNALVSQVEPVTATTSITTTYGYDAAGNRTRYTDGRGNPFITTYNSWNLPESLIEPSTPAYPNLPDRTFTTAYDANARATTTTKPGGVTLTNAYDTVGNLTGQTGAGAEATTTSRTFGYDLDGRVTSASAPGGTDTFAYDDRGLLLSTTGPSGASSFGYNADGQVTTRTDAAGTTGYTYDSLGRLGTVTNSGTGVNLTVGYNTLNQLASITYNGGNQRTFGYDGLHRLTSDTLKTSASATVASIGYGYDNNSNITSKTTAGFAGSAANTYTYDWSDRLTSWNNGFATTNYGYDASGNRTQNGVRTFAYDARDRLTTGGGNTYSYTARGTLKSTVAATGTTNTTSDAFDQAITQGTATRTYDALGRLVIAGLSYTGAGNTLAGDGTNKYTRSPDDSLIGTKTSSASLYSWTDQHLDVVGQFTATSTVLSGSTNYDPLGKVTASNTPAGNLGFQSGWTESSSGRVNMAARWYNPDTGQFDSRDSVANSPSPNSGDANPFAYSGNPLGDTDLTGHYHDQGSGPQYEWTGTHWITAGLNLDLSGPACGPNSYYSNGSGCAGHRPTVHGPNDGKPTLAHGQHGEQLYEQQSCPRNPDGTANYFANCTTLIETDDGYVSIDGIVIKREVLQGIDPRDIAQQIDESKNSAHPDELDDVAAYTASRLEKAAQDAANHEQDLNDQAKKLQCDASWTCRNAGLLGTIAGAVVGVICETAVTVASGGALSVPGAIGCGALGGLVSSLSTSYLQGKDMLSKEVWIDAAVSVGVGALAGGLGGALGGAASKVGGALASKIVGNGASSLAAKVTAGAIREAVGGALTGGLIGAASGAAEYGSTCVRAHDCSAGGFAAAAGEGAVGGAVSGAITGGVLGGARAARGARGSSAAPDETAAPAKREGCTAPGNSFAPATPVLMADGSTKAIEDIKVGDRVLSTDPANDLTVGEPVTDLHLNKDTELTDLTVLAGTGVAATGVVVADAGLANGSASGSTAIVHTTAHHPIWDETAGAWVAAGDLVARHQLRTPTGSITLLAVHSYAGSSWMRNLTVATVHSYYVIAGNEPLLVHNCGGPSCTCAAEGFPNYDKAGGWVAAMGPARDFAGPGETLNWEHVVEQTQAGKSGFPQEWINHPDNMMLLDSKINFAKNGYYSKTFNWTGNESIRKMLTGMPFNQQFDFGMYVINTLKTYGKEGLPGDV